MRRPQVVLVALAAVACLMTAGAVTVGVRPTAAVATPVAGAGPAAVAAPAGQADDPPGTAGATPSGRTTAGGAEDGTGETTPATGVPTEDIIPEPNSGRPPTEPGDRGGMLQIAVLLAIVTAVVGIAAKIARDSRRARQARTSHAGR